MRAELHLLQAPVEGLGEGDDRRLIERREGGGLPGRTANRVPPGRRRRQLAERSSNHCVASSAWREPCRADF